MIINLITCLICGCLFSWGGYNWHNARRFMFPLVIAIVCAFNIHSYLGLLPLSSIPFLCLGYGEKSPIRHIFGDVWGRAIWAGLVSISISVGLLVIGHLAWYLFIPYIVLCSLLESSLRNINQVLSDFVFGLAFASIVFLIH